MAHLGYGPRLFEHTKGTSFTYECLKLSTMQHTIYKKSIFDKMDPCRPCGPHKNLKTPSFWHFLWRTFFLITDIMTSWISRWDFKSFIYLCHAISLSLLKPISMKSNIMRNIAAMKTNGSGIHVCISIDVCIINNLDNI